MRIGSSRVVNPARPDLVRRLPLSPPHRALGALEPSHTCVYRLLRNFKDASLQLPGFNAAVEVMGAKNAIKSAVNKIGAAVVEPAKQIVGSEVVKAVNDLFGSEIHEIAGLAQWVLQETGAVALEQVAQHVAEMLPFISVAVGGAKTLSQWGMVVYKGY